MKFSSIGRRLRKYREEKGWKQEELAERTNLSVSYIGMIERGEKLPRLETFILIANTLDASADILLCDVLKAGYSVKGSILGEKFDNLSAESKSEIMAVVELMIEHEIKRS